MLRIFLVTAAALALPAPPAAAQTVVGVTLTGEVQDICKDDDEAPVALCKAYLRGTFEGLLFGQMSSPDGQLSFCLPYEGMDMSELRETFMAFVKAEPDRRSEQASVSMLESLEARYPCSGTLEWSETASLAPARSAFGV